MLPDGQYTINKTIKLDRTSLGPRLKEIYDPRPEKIIFVKGDPTVKYQEIIEGVTEEDLLKELKYSRGKDKSDKSAEAYKFFANALYVAITRAVRSVYVIEQDHRHRLFDMLGLKRTSEHVRMAAQVSSKEDWEREARRLELQGKQEQAESIRRDLLGNQVVPWKVLTPATLSAAGDARPAPSGTRRPPGGPRRVLPLLGALPRAADTARTRTCPELPCGASCSRKAVQSEA